MKRLRSFRLWYRRLRKTYDWQESFWAALYNSKYWPEPVGIWGEPLNTQQWPVERD